MEINQKTKAGNGATMAQIGVQNNIVFNIPPKFRGLLRSLCADYVSRDELNNFAQQMEQRLNKISNEDRTDPSINIWGAAIDALKWNLSITQAHIRDMFIKILTADVDKTKKSLVQPAFIEIVKQLSTEDAHLLADILKNTRLSTSMKRESTLVRWARKESPMSFPG